MKEEAPMKLRTVHPTEIFTLRATHVCANCGAALTVLLATENEEEHRCDGDFEWLDRPIA